MTSVVEFWYLSAHLLVFFCRRCPHSFDWLRKAGMVRPPCYACFVWELGVVKNDTVSLTLWESDALRCVKDLVRRVRLVRLQDCVYGCMCRSAGVLDVVCWAWWMRWSSTYKRQPWLPHFACCFTSRDLIIVGGFSVLLWSCGDCGDFSVCSRVSSVSVSGGKV